jgi:hypothetical protein
MILKAHRILTIGCIFISFCICFSCKQVVKNDNDTIQQLTNEVVDVEIETKVEENELSADNGKVVEKDFFENDLPKKEKVIQKESKPVLNNSDDQKVKRAKNKKKREPTNIPVVKEKPKVLKKGILNFYEEEYDFGFIEVGEVVDYSFEFVNTGTADINISNVIASCGCTTPVFPFLPIEPGKKGKISVRFNSKDRLGGQLATVTVYSDAKNNELELKLKGIIRSEIVSPSEFVDTTKN